MTGGYSLPYMPGGRSYVGRSYVAGFEYRDQLLVMSLEDGAHPSQTRHESRGGRSDD